MVAAGLLPSACESGAIRREEGCERSKEIKVKEPQEVKEWSAPGAARSKMN